MADDCEYRDGLYEIGCKALIAFNDERIRRLQADSVSVGCGLDAAAANDEMSMEDITVDLLTSLLEVARRECFDIQALIREASGTRGSAGVIGTHRPKQTETFSGFEIVND